MQVFTIPIDKFVPDPFQPRRAFLEPNEIDMANSLVNLRQQVPMIVVRDGETFPIIDGEMRWRGGKRGGLSSMNAVVLEKRPDEAELLMIQLTVNCIRSDLLPLERTEAYKRVMSLKSITASELAKQLGVSKAYITRYLSLDKLPESLKSPLRDGSLSSAKAYALSRMNEEQREQAIANMDSGATRDDLERLARRPPKKKGPTSQIRNLRYELPDCTLALRTSKSMTVEALIDALCDLLKACRKAKSQKLELGTMALVIRDRTRATQPTVDEPCGEPAT